MLPFPLSGSRAGGPSRRDLDAVCYLACVPPTQVPQRRPHCRQHGVPDPDNPRVLSEVGGHHEPPFEFDVLLVRETSRFARNWRQAGGYEDRLHEAGVVVAYIYEGRLPTDRAGQLQLVVNHAINKEYREKLADNVQRGYRVKRFEVGKFSGTPPIGYVMEYVDATVDGAKGYERTLPLIGAVVPGEVSSIGRALQHVA
jgi:hypothetical protein